jgi:hypothetical protein
LGEALLQELLRLPKPIFMLADRKGEETPRLTCAETPSPAGTAGS